MQDTQPLLTSSTWTPNTTTAFNISAILSSLNMSTLPTLEPFHKQLSSNTTTPRDIGSTPAPPTTEPLDHRLTYIQKMLEQFTFKPINDWKPYNKLPEYKPKYYQPPPPAPVPKNGALSIAILVAGLSGGFIILAFICFCVCSRKSDRPRRKPNPRGTNWSSWYYGTNNIEMGADPSCYSYNNYDVNVETGTDAYDHCWASDGAGCDTYSCDADGGGGDCGGGDCGGGDCGGGDSGGGGGDCGGD